MSSPGLVLKARDRMREARDSGVPGLVLEQLIQPAATRGVNLQTIADKVTAGERITPEEGLWLLTDAPLLALGEMASMWKQRYNPEARVTFVIDTNPNYTNFCDADCLFCAFYRKPGDTDEGYAHSVDELMALVGRSVGLGATTVLLQGGLHDELELSYYVDVVKAFRERYPQVHPHLWSAPEIGKMREVSGLSYDDIFAELHKAGQRTMPGGGAELLSDRVRARISPKKQSSLEWLEIHRAAHRQGLRTTGTMMYGHAEQAPDIIEHLECLRGLQDDTGGFTAFIPWSYKPGNTPMQGQVPEYPGPAVYLRVLALSRIYLDNFEHVQASWFSDGKKAGQAALHFGCDDFGGTLIEENVLFEADHDVSTTTEETIEIIREAGFTPARRGTPLYDVIETY